MSFIHFHHLTNQFSASFLISEDKHHEAPHDCEDPVFSSIISVCFSDIGSRTDLPWALWCVCVSPVQLLCVILFASWLY